MRKILLLKLYELLYNPESFRTIERTIEIFDPEFLEEVEEEIKNNLDKNERQNDFTSKYIEFIDPILFNFEQNEKENSKRSK